MTLRIKVLIGTLLITVLSVLLYVKQVVSGEKLVIVLLLASFVLFIVCDQFVLEDNRIGNVLSRIKSLFIGLGFLLAAGAGIWGIYGDISDGYRLHFYGSDTIGKVVSCETQFRRRRRGRTQVEYSHTIAYEGHLKKFDLDKQYPVGTQFNIKYLKSAPLIARMLNPGETMLSTTFNMLHIFWMLLIVGAIILGVSWLIEFVKPPLREEDHQPINMPL